MSNIAIMTNFMDFHPGYSLTGIVSDQITMLTKFGHNVHLFVNEQYNPQYDTDEIKEKANFEKSVPFTHLVDYTSESKLSAEHKNYSNSVAIMMREKFEELQIDYVFTHDWVFTGWNLPYSEGIRKASPRLPDVRWFHWIHSVPSVMRDWWQINRYGPGHRIVFPNNTERLRVAEQYRGTIEDVRVVPHIKDLRTWYEFDSETCRFIDDYPGVMQAEFVQIYPASTDRLSAKRVDAVSGIFGMLKKRGHSVCLVVANQWATGRARKEDVNKYYNIATSAGLVKDEDFIFTSEWDEQYATGIPRRMLRELQLCSNLFMFPTREESFGLVGPEAALAGVFMGLNKSLTMMYEIFGHEGLYNDYGSHHQNFEPPDVQEHYRMLASIVLGRYKQNEALLTKTYCRLTYNYDALYLRVYEPLLAESKTWAE